MLLPRALAAFLALPSMVAGVIPALIVAGMSPHRETLLLALAVLALGSALLIWCVRDFFVAGRGTLAPWDPPKRLVVVGLYRYVRNPMYLSVLTIVGGWVLLYHSLWLLAYLAGLIVSFHLRVVYNEEPRLRRAFGAEWTTYAARVLRWLPRRAR